MDTFSYKWTNNKAKNYGLSLSTLTRCRNELFNLFYVKSINELKKIFGDGKRVLDAGCGIGWAEWAFNINKKCKRVAFDCSQSVKIAFQRCIDVDNIQIDQCDIFNMPYKDHSFDVIFANGVLHHTHTPLMAFRELVKKLKSGGTMAIYIYCRKPFCREILDHEIRACTTIWPNEKIMEFAEQMAALGKSFKRIKQDIVIDKDIPFLEIKTGKYNLQRFIYNHLIKCFTSNIGKDYDVINNFDWYAPGLASHHTKEEILDWYEGCGFKDIIIHQPEGWEYSGYFAKGVKK